MKRTNTLIKVCKYQIVFIYKTKYISTKEFETKYIILIIYSLFFLEERCMRGVECGDHCEKTADLRKKKLKIRVNILLFHLPDHHHNNINIVIMYILYTGKNPRISNTRSELRNTAVKYVHASVGVRMYLFFWYKDKELVSCILGYIGIRR